MQRILVPLDGSARAEYALPVAARLARATGGTLILLRVYQVMPSECVLSDYAAEAAPATAYLARVAQRQELAGIPSETIALAGALALTILDAVQEYRADTIVLCSHGLSGPTRWALGSVAEKVARHAPVPVLVLREHADPPLDLQLATSRPLRALVALDGSSFAEAALAPAAQLIWALSAPNPGALHLVRVVQPSANSDDEQGTLLGRDSSLQEQALWDAQDYLRAVVDRVRTAEWGARKLQLTWSAVIAEDVATTLIQLAEGVTAPLIQLAQDGEEGEDTRKGTALIALATHGRGGLQRWTVGSVAQRVLEATRMPLLLVRPPWAADKQEQAASPASPAAGPTE